MTERKRLIVALDTETFDEAERLIDILADEVDIFKVGIAPFTGFGEKLLEKLAESGKKVFLDLKVHDIPNTVKNAAKRAAEKNVFMMNFHCLGGEEMLKAAVLGASMGAAGGNPPILLGVTILTSTTEKEMGKIGLSGTVEDKVLELAEMAKASGLGGVVASAKEAKKIRQRLGKDFVIVTPGVRPRWAAKGDQKRVLTPKEAITEGADYIVVGRPIIEAADPLLAAKKIISELEGK